ncbi:MMPL family transporter [Williamsia sterculiae]|uniref:Putative drug exporter of the RND superfamily n=1 Tax=Williamsia sterculiae TaxID=1344003 RepID=A0A1N7CD46_9NOCA|nr:MMPL family transporter [Williamsia sterculiae]SIR61515.1 putative drug exporter of the RND superfamily [Williamsia sterculiae]
MFGAIGAFVYRMRFSVIAVLIVLMAGLGIFGLGLSKYLSQSGFFDPHSQSVKGAEYADATFGRDHKSDLIMLVTAPQGTKVDDPAFGARIEKIVTDLQAAHPDVVNAQDPGIIDPYSTTSAVIQTQVRERLFDASKQHAFVSIGIKGDDDTSILNNYKKVAPFLDDVPKNYDLQGATVEFAGLQPIADALANGMDADVHRAELIALPLVAIMLFFVFGGVVAAILPVLIGGLTIAGSLGIMTALARATEVNVFAQPVVTLIGLGIAIDYGLFIVSRFREEIAEGYATGDAVRRTVMTAGQTVVFSASIIVAALACLLIFPQGFLKSVSYGALASVSLAAILSITVLPAILGVLGPRIDMWGLGLRRFLRQNKTREQVERGFWGRLAGFVMRHPMKVAIPTALLLLALTLPFANIKFGGITEKYLPPDNTTRVAQEHFDRYFPTERTEDIKLVVKRDANSTDANDAVQQIETEANKIPGFTKQFSTDSTTEDAVQMSAGLIDRDTAPDAIKALRGIDTHGLTMYVTGTPTLTQDSIDALLDELPLMVVMLLLVTGLLMFLAFGSLVLPIKAALMSALGLGSTLGILTWIFIDGHGSGIANFTPGPLMSAVLVLIICIVFGLSTDYEVFLLSRMVEARQKGATTTEAVRSGTAQTGRIITAAAAILVVVTGAFGLSEIVMMKYIAYGMIAALILDATIIRMLLVPAVMRLLGDDCWWAPHWMKVLQRKIGLGETVLDDEPSRKHGGAPAKVSAGRLVAEAPTSAFGAAAASSATAVGAATAVGSAEGRVPAAQARRGDRTESPSAGRPSGPVYTTERRAEPSRIPTGEEQRGVPWGGHDGATSSGEGRAPRRAQPVRGDGTRPPGPNGPRPFTPRPDIDGVAERTQQTPGTSGPWQRRPQTRRPDDTGSGRRLPRESRPDTGGWSLGDSGIRLAQADAADRAQSGRTERPSGPRPRPQAPDQGVRPPRRAPVTDLSDEADGPDLSPRPRSSDGRGGTAPRDADRRSGDPRGAEQPVADDGNTGRRHDRGDSKQISVRDLLRRGTRDD